MALARILLLFLALWGAPGSWAQDPGSVRMGFLLNFCRYIEWPDTVLSPGAALRVCMAPGDSDMAAQLAELAKQSVQGRPIQIKLLARPAEAAGCHVVYLPSEVPGALPVWLAAAQKPGILTVSDAPDFVDSGGMVGLAAVAGRYRFDINLGTARQADLRFSSQLLKLARTVR